MSKITALAMAAGLLVGLTAAPAAQASIDIHFDDGLATPAPGYVIVDTFDTAEGLTGTNFQIKVPPADGNGAPPANSIPSGTPYLSVLAGGSATYTFAAPVSSFQFDWGSINDYNTLTINGTSQAIIVPGANFIVAVNSGVSGRFTVTGTQGELFTSVTFSTTGNSFEVDNLAVQMATSPVPEPAVWAMMLMGFGAVGATLRRRPIVATRVRFG